MRGWVKMKRLIRRRRNGRSKHYSVYLEYAMLAALIGIVGATAVWKFGDEIKNFFEQLTGKTEEASSRMNKNK